MTTFWLPLVESREQGGYCVPDGKRKRLEFANPPEPTTPIWYAWVGFKVTSEAELFGSLLSFTATFERLVTITTLQLMGMTPAPETSLQVEALMASVRMAWVCS